MAGLKFSRNQHFRRKKLKIFIFEINFYVRKAPGSITKALHARSFIRRP